MRPFALLLAASLAVLVFAASGSARPQTTNPGSYLTVRLTVSGKGVALSTPRGRRGSTAIFLLANNAKTSQVVAVGDASLTHVRGTGFAVKLKPNERRRVLMYLTYRGPLPVKVGDAGKAKVLGVFRVI
jgi:hypothetical protein